MLELLRVLMFPRQRLCLRSKTLSRQSNSTSGGCGCPCGHMEWDGHHHSRRDALYGWGIVGHAKGKWDLSVWDGRNVLEDQKSGQIPVHTWMKILTFGGDKIPSPVEPEQGRGTWRGGGSRKLGKAGWCHLTWGCQTCSHLSQHLSQHLPQHLQGLA